ncbi:MAG: dihydroflavonol-4-reductase [Saprospiraceae bacterium]|jgi:dihydroflavonol-4-reductase
MGKSKDEHILITGGTGLVGSYLLRTLVLAGYSRLTALHRKSSNFDLIEEEVRKQIKWVACDLSDDSSLAQLLSNVNIVIHCAGMISFWPREYELMHEVNFLATKRLATESVKQGVRLFIHFSSVEALGRRTFKGFINEDSTFNEDDAFSKYAISKNKGENAVRSSGLDYVILYPGFILGGGQWTNGPLQIFREIYKGLKFYPKGGVGVVDVRDVAAIIERILQNDSIKNEGYILISENITHKSLFEKIAKALNLAAPSIGLSDTLARFVIAIESIKSRFTNSKPLLNKEMYKIASYQLQYSNQKIIDETQFEFREVNNTIADTSKCFLDSSCEGKSFGILEL